MPAKDRERFCMQKFAESLRARFRQADIEWKDGEEPPISGFISMGADSPLNTLRFSDKTTLYAPQPFTDSLMKQRKN
jgi:hypothetical protein